MVYMAKKTIVVANVYKDSRFFRFKAKMQGRSNQSIYGIKRVAWN